MCALPRAHQNPYSAHHCLLKCSRIYFPFSAAAFIFAKPRSKSPPTILSMLTNTHMTFEANGIGPCIDQFTCDAPPWGCTANSAILWPSNGLMKSNLIVTFSGVTSRSSIRPFPTLLFPSHSYTDPFPLAGPLYVLFIAGSSFSLGDQGAHR